MNVELLFGLVIALGVAGGLFLCLNSIIADAVDLPDEFSAHEAFLIEEIKRAEKLLGKSA